MKHNLLRTGTQNETPRHRARTVTLQTFLTTTSHEIKLSIQF